MLLGDSILGTPIQWIWQYLTLRKKVNGNIESVMCSLGAGLTQSELSEQGWSIDSSIITSGIYPSHRQQWGAIIPKVIKMLKPIIFSVCVFDSTIHVKTGENVFKLLLI